MTKTSIALWYFFMWDLKILNILYFAKVLSGKGLPKTPLWVVWEFLCKGHFPTGLILVIGSKQTMSPKCAAFLSD